MAKDYTKDSIAVLSDLEHMKIRRGMYIGEGQDPRQLISEIFDNAIDEVQAGFSPKLIVNVNTTTNEYSVRDFGRGIPHGKKELENGVKKEVIEVLLTKANSGGKFNNDSYSYSSGLNGLGLTITNALSNYIEITSYRKKKFVKGTAHSSDKVELEYGATSEPDGTLVRFQPNKEMFHTDIIPIDFIKGRCEIANALGFNSELFVDGKQIAIKSNMFDLIKEGENSFSTYADIGPIEVISSTKEKMKVALRYTSDTSDKYYGFTNLLSNYLGGTHINELSKAVTNTWKSFLDSHKKFRPSIELRDNDFRVGLRGVCAVFIAHPEFSSQTKEKLVVNKVYFNEIMEKFQKAFGKFLNENELIARQLLKRFEEYRVAQNALLSRKEIGSLIKINTDSDDNIRRKSVVSKLVECTSRKRDGTELFIVEGDSALGPYLYTRNKETQAVLPIRGKILNVTNKSIKEAIKNNEVCDIANAIGAGIGGACDASKSRYEKIILSADADEDGKQINCLLLSLFVNLFPDIIKSGRLYITIPPLYCWGDSTKNYGWCNQVEDIPANAKNVHRFKGLGEMNNDQLDYFLVKPKTRNIIQIEYPSDVEEFNRIMGTSAGKNNLYKELGIIV